MEILFDRLLIIMSVLAVIVFVALFFVKAGYGVFYNHKWGISVNNKWGWVMMESPVFLAMLLLWMFSDRQWEVVPFIMFLFFQIHYFQRSFIFPFMIRGKNRMPLAIILLGIVFNLMNALMQGGWIFYVSPEDYYTVAWLQTPQFLIGTMMFFAGMLINISSDKIIRNLRKDSETGHKIPHGGMFKFVSSANYFGEFTEWVGFAVLTWSWSGAVFALWTFANLAPRAAALYKNYEAEFGEEFTNEHRRKMIPFIY